MRQLACLLLTAAVVAGCTRLEPGPEPGCIIEIAYPPRGAILDQTNVKNLSALSVSVPIRAYFIPDGGWGAAEEAFLAASFNLKMDFEADLPVRVRTTESPALPGSNGFGRIQVEADLPQGGEHVFVLRAIGGYSPGYRTSAADRTKPGWPPDAYPEEPAYDIGLMTFPCPHVTFINDLGGDDVGLIEIQYFMSEHMDDATLTADSFYFGSDGVEIAPRSIQQRRYVSPLSGAAEWYISIIFDPPVPSGHMTDLVMRETVKGSSGAALAGNFGRGQCSCRPASYEQHGTMVRPSNEPRIRVASYACRPSPAR